MGTRHLPLSLHGLLDKACPGAGGGVPGEAPFAIVRGVWGWALTIPRLPSPEVGSRGLLPTCFRCGVQVW